MLEQTLASIAEAINRQAAAVEASNKLMEAVLASREAAAGNVVPMKPAAPKEVITEETVPTKVAPAKKAGRPRATPAAEEPAPEENEPEIPVAANSASNSEAGDDRPDVDEFEDPAEVTAILTQAVDAAKNGAAKAGDKRAAYMAAFEDTRVKHGIAKGERPSTVIKTLAAARAFKAAIEAIAV